MSTTAASRERAKGPVTLSAWGSRANHTITCPSGAVVTIRFPDLSRLIRNDTLPEGLRAMALRQAFDDLELAAPVGEETVDEDARKKGGGGAVQTGERLRGVA